MPVRRGPLLTALALAAGSVDAATYLGIGHAFPANMTGNTVLLAIGIGRGGGADAARAAVVLGGFAIGVLVGVALERRDRPWPAGAVRPFVLQILCLAAVGLTWGGAGLHATALRLGLLALTGAAMGLQSAASRAARVGGVATTYVTGTLTGALASLHEREDPEARRRGALAGVVWLVYALGALCGALLERAGGAVAFILPTVILLAMCVATLTLGDRPGVP